MRRLRLCVALCWAPAMVILVALGACSGAAAETARQILADPQGYVHRQVTLTGWIQGTQSRDGVAQYSLWDSSETSIPVHTVNPPSRGEAAGAVTVTGEVRLDPANSQPYVYELSRGVAGGEVPPPPPPNTMLYVLIGAGALLVVLAVVLVVLLGSKKAPAPEPAIIGPGARIGDTAEVPSPSGPSAAGVTEEFAAAGEPLTAEFLGASLDVVEGADSSKPGFPMLKKTVTIGRKADRDVRLTDPTVSREHARIIAKDDGSLLLLNESTKGTMVNEQPVDSQLLQNGDKIRLGGTVMEVRLSGKPGAAPAAAGGETVEFAGAGAAAAPGQPPVGGTQEFLGAQLRATSGPHDGKTFVLSKSITSIGRDPSNDWALGQDDMTVSGVHCEIHHKSGVFTLVAKPDASKGHKTVLVNGQEVVTQELQSGDEIQLGGTKMAFEKV